MAGSRWEDRMQIRAAGFAYRPIGSQALAVPWTNTRQHPNGKVSRLKISALCSTQIPSLVSYDQ